MRVYTDVWLALWLAPDIRHQFVLNPALLPAGATCIPADDFHLSLFSLGEADDLEAQRTTISTIVAETARQMHPIPGIVSGTGAFRNETHQFLHVRVDSPGVATLRETLMNRFEHIGIAARNQRSHRFNPHISLAILPINGVAPVVGIPTSRVQFSQLAIAWRGVTHMFPFLGESRFVYPQHSPWK